MEKKFRALCAERSFSLLVYILTEIKLFREAMLAIADCLVSTTPTTGKSIQNVFVLIGNITNFGKVKFLHSLKIPFCSTI
jgi:hypothetical protein